MTKILRYLKRKIVREWTEKATSKRTQVSNIFSELDIFYIHTFGVPIVSSSPCWKVKGWYENLIQDCSKVKKRESP